MYFILGFDVTIWQFDTMCCRNRGLRFWLALCRQAVFTGCVALSLSHAQAATPTPLTFRISTENTPAHFQTKVVQRFSDELARRTKGRLEVEFRHSAQLFRDQDVIRAVNEGKVEMAVPGNWQLDRYDPWASLLTLPMFMGRSAAEHHSFRDGKVGQEISDHLAKSLNVVIPGRWIDLGYAHVFTSTKSIGGFEDMAGLRIRIAGGSAVAAHLSAVGAIPTIVAWPDFPNVFQQGRLDGLLTTYETIASAKLWTIGVKHVTENQAYFAQYIPVVSQSYWDSLAPDLRQAVRESWESVVDDARVRAGEAQKIAKLSLIAHGVAVTELSPLAIKAWRTQAMKDQNTLATKIGIPHALLQESERLLARSQ
ncbi:MAG: TRAP transporter substrate-binding protein DctP [Rhodoferax sp.]|uniref:TRAP transporter substrate-binding protein DctP n=1 Tax=Rhodoferax sp. TaxID=50421 RepID=UPI0027365568|nr:TRAP transporter substrate-binding protein DctP [Rhodoferax sp.]MDP2679105.1 TRAP transporter substrate-binding protein DctP [Rhodoferax sp.]